MVAYIFVALSVVAVAYGQWHLSLCVIAGLAMSGGLRLLACEFGWHTWKRFRFGKECCVCARRRWVEAQL